ncbi:hypothetical protein M9979_16275 [Sphingomonas sp. RP10(2022)]|uniref:DUF7847 domain-containing protein n=1 Tax=Sphingomonas liriopis TaxID=2949094 RepID=A0A9X2HVS9_9SPHN|nr:hypothetical protein [Sphingomonas liriopis]MCP3736424.1 hypothetical protein [Sphingomonas liriopis]
MGNVWDRTVEVLNGRGGMLAGLALLTLFVPTAIPAAFKAYATPSTATTLIGVLLLVVTTVIALWGQLAMIAASIDPATDGRAARTLATARLPAALLVAVVLAVVLTIAFLPSLALLVRAGFDWTAIAQGAQPAPTAPGAAALAGLYALVLGIVLLFVGARLLPLYAVVLDERLGLGAVARCWRLTRRHTWRLVGTILLFLIVLLIATWAAQSVVGLIARLILGGEAVASVGFIAALAGQAVSTALTLVAIVFSAQLYVALTRREQALREKRAAALHDGQAA